MKVNFEELQKKYAEKAAALKKEKQEAMKQAKAKVAKEQAAERAKLRKTDTHIKVVLGGWVLSEIRAGKMERDLLDKVIATLKTERDKETFKALKASLPSQKVNPK